MERIRITRENDWIYRDFSLKVKINGEYRGSVKWKDYLDFRVTAGIHNVELTIGIAKENFDVEVKEGKPSIIIVKLPNPSINLVGLLIDFQRGIRIKTTSTDMRAEKYG